MDSEHARAVLDRLHQALNAMYVGGGLEPVASVVSEDVEWHIPGKSPIAGHYRGIAEVLEYLRRRRELAGGSLQPHPAELLIGYGDHAAVLISTAA